MSEKEYGVREISERSLAGARVSARVVTELGENKAIKRAVASGLWITLISATVARKERRGRDLPVSSSTPALPR